MRSCCVNETMMFDVERCKLCGEFDRKGSANSTNLSDLCVALNGILNGLRDLIPSGEMIQQFEIYYSKRRLTSNSFLENHGSNLDLRASKLMVGLRYIKFITPRKRRWARTRSAKPVNTDTVLLPYGRGEDFPSLGA
jgi:hypothetical protein